MECIDWSEAILLGSISSLIWFGVVYLAAWGAWRAMRKYEAWKATRANKNRGWKIK